jgi:hypothetical protein
MYSYKIKLVSYLIIFILNSCNPNFTANSIISDHGISRERFSIVEKKWKNKNLPFPLFNCMNPLTVSEVEKIVFNSFPDRRQSEFRVFNTDPTQQPGTYRFILSSWEPLTEREFIEIASGARTSQVDVENIILEPPSRRWGAIVP